MDDEGMHLCYGSDSIQWVNDFSRQTQTKSGGITILDGPAGTGKSTLIAQLMRRLYQTHVFYVLSVAQHEALSCPGMVEFWQQQNGRRPNEVKVIIMEDAEKILLQRRSDNNEAVSALLNIADGLIGQMLRVHVICTLNQGMEYLDPAILRPGRLRSYRYVGLLSRDEAQKLAAKHKLPFAADEDRDQFTLAEVFHGQVYKQQTRKIMGFQSTPKEHANHSV
jgi:SpoVK/Ycf46/Vps4 family AAA+-type ATPase